MCLCDMSFGNFMSRERFLKSAQKKKCLNKSKAVPNMRVEALLEATCKRLRLERKQIKRELIKDEFDDEIVAKKVKLDVDNTDCDEDVDDTDDIILESNEKCDSEELSFIEPCTMVGEKDISSKTSLWDDPKQVEDFLKLVNATNNNNIITNNNNSLVEDNYGKNFGLEFEDDFLDACDDDPTSNLSSFVTNYDVNSFTVEFDNLYKELVQNLVTVETFMSQPACT